MTFKQFRQWCNDRACDGCWGKVEALLCIQFAQEIAQLPFWRREKEWKKIAQQMETLIINPINQKIKEVRGDDNA